MKIQVLIPILILIISASTKPASGETDTIPEDVREFVSGAVMLSCSSGIQNITLISTESRFETIALSNTTKHELYNLELDIESPNNALGSKGFVLVEKSSTIGGERSNLKIVLWDMRLEVCDAEPSKLSLRCGDHWLEAFVDVDSALSSTTIYWAGDSGPAIKKIRSDVRFILDSQQSVPMIRVEFAERVDGSLVLLKNSDSSWSANYTIDGVGPFELGTCY